MKKKKILFMTSSLEEKTRGIGIILKNLIYSAKEEGHECGLLMGFCDPGFKEKLYKKDLENQLLIRSYLKRGQELFKLINPEGSIKINILKHLIKLEVFRSHEINIEKISTLKNNDLLNYIDFVIKSPYIYRFLDHNYKILCRKIFAKIVKQYKIDLIVAASPTILRSKDVRPAKLAQFIHDIMPLEIKEIAVKKSFKKRFKKSINSTVERSDFILTNSYDTARKIGNKNNIHVLYGSSLNKTTVLYDLRHLLTYYHLKEKAFLLFVSAIEKRKNIINLLSAYAMIANQIDMPLVIVGQPGSGYDTISSYYEKMPETIKKKIIFTGHVSEEEKRALYQYAYAFIFPSFYEGLGLGVIEAMEYDLPVVISRCGGLKEAGGDAALYIEDPYNPSEIAEKLLRICQDKNLRQTMIEKGKIVASKFSFDKFKERFANVIARV